MICDKVSILGLLVVISATINSISCGDAACGNGLPNYRYYPYDCQKYFGCDNFNLNLYTCPNNLYWNDAVKACDVHDKTDCSNIIPFPEPDCSNGTNTYYIYPYDCAKFWECYQQQVYLLECPNRSLWNDRIKECDEHTNVDCSHVIPYPSSTTSSTALPTTPSPTTPSTTPSSSTSPSTTAPPPEPVTPPECTYDNTYYPYPYDCSKFYECSNGQPVVIQCKDGLMWNDRIKNCDHPYNVDCSYVIPTAPATSTTTRTTPTTTRTTPTTTKTTRTTTRTSPTTTRTTPTTTRTTRTTTRTTPTTTRTSPTTTRTTRTTTRTTPATSRTTPTTTRTTPTTTRTTPTTTRTTPTTTRTTPTTPRTSPSIASTSQSPIPTPPVCDWKTEYYPYPYDCTKYYECLDRELLLKDCNKTMYWNNELKRCDHKWNVDCAYTITYPTTFTPAISTSFHSMVCSAEQNFFVHPSDCTKYYECINDTLVLKECPEAMVWDRKREVCDFIGDVDCSNV